MSNDLAERINKEFRKKRTIFIIDEGGIPTNTKWSAEINKRIKSTIKKMLERDKDKVIRIGK